MTQFITKKDYDSLEECKCGGPLLKFHNTSKNEFVAKCGYFKKIIEIDRETKRKIWITPKRPACDWRVVFPSERPIFKEINNVLKKSIVLDKKNINELLEERLKVLFRFLHVSNHSSTLDEINIIVKNNLVRESKLKLETFKEYEQRIFSKKIIDLSHTIIPPKIETSFVFYDLPCLQRIKQNIIPKQIKKVKTISQFVEVTDEPESNDSDTETEAETEAETEVESEAESEEDFDRDQSDFESVFDDPVEDIDNYEETDAPDYYDD